MFKRTLVILGCELLTAATFVLLGLIVFGAVK